MVMHSSFQKFCFNYHIFTTLYKPLNTQKWQNSEYTKREGKKKDTTKSHSLFRDYYQTERKSNLPKKDNNHKLSISRNPNSNKFGFSFRGSFPSILRVGIRKNTLPINFYDLTMNSTNSYTVAKYFPMVWTN